MVIDSIRASLVNHQRVVILKEKEAERYLPIWVGPVEADAIAVKLHQVNIPRPLTHDLLSSVVHALGASVKFIFIDDLRDDTFFAKVNLSIDGKQVEVDSRPSDAMALAVRVSAPIFADIAVLNKAGFVLDREGNPTPMNPEANVGESVSEDELNRLSVFSDFINSLDMSDFDKGKD